MEPLVKFQPILNLTDFRYSRPNTKIYVAYLMYTAFLFRPSIYYYITVVTQPCYQTP